MGHWIRKLEHSITAVLKYCSVYTQLYMYSCVHHGSTFEHVLNLNYPYLLRSLPPLRIYYYDVFDGWEIALKAGGTWVLASTAVPGKWHSRPRPPPRIKETRAGYRQVPSTSRIKVPYSNIALVQYLNMTVRAHMVVVRSGTAAVCTRVANTNTQTGSYYVYNGRLGWAPSTKYERRGINYYS